MAYTVTTDFAPNTRVTSALVDAEFSAIATWSATLPSSFDSDNISFVAAGGTADAITVAHPVTTWTTYTGKDGFRICIQVGSDNTGAVTLNVDSLGAKACKRNNGDALSAGDLQANGFYDFVYDEAAGNFKVMGPPEAILASESAAAASAAAASASASAASTSETNAAASESAAAASAASITVPVVFNTVTDSTDISLGDITSTQSNFGTSFSATIPTTGLIRITPVVRLLSDSAAVSSMVMGIRIASTNYWPKASNNGSDYYVPSQSSPSSSGQYYEGFGGTGGETITTNIGGTTQGIDIAKSGMPTGSQTIQVVVARSTANAGTVKGTAVTSRAFIEIWDGS